MSELKHELPNCEKCGNEIHPHDFNGVLLLCGNCYDKQQRRAGKIKQYNKDGSVSYISEKERKEISEEFAKNLEKEIKKEFGITDMEKKLQINIAKTVTTTEQVIVLKKELSQLNVRIQRLEHRNGILIAFIKNFIKDIEILETLEEEVEGNDDA